MFIHTYNKSMKNNRECEKKKTNMKLTLKKIIQIIINN